MEGPGRHAYPHEHLAVVSDGTYGYTIGGRCLSTETGSPRCLNGSISQSGGMDQVVRGMPTPSVSYGAADSGWVQRSVTRCTASVVRTARRMTYQGPIVTIEALDFN